MNNILAYINRRVKHQEKHLDVKATIKGEEIGATFSRFYSFSSDGADIELVSSNKKLELHYDFNSGRLTEEGTDIDVNDLFSSRHLRSLLFTAHKEYFLKTRDNNSSDFTTIFHKYFPLPIFCTEMQGEKRWFSIESIDIVRDAKIKMEGLLSIENTFVHQPIKARCEFDIRKNKFNWKYKLDGKLRQVVEKENYYSWHKLKMSEILYCYTEWKIENSYPNGPIITYEMLRVLKKQKPLFVLRKREIVFWKMGENIINALFWGIKSINNDEIVFLACDGKTLSREITFNRNERKIYAIVSGVGRKKQQVFEFTNNKDDQKFFKVIKLIEKRLDTTR